MARIRGSNTKPELFVRKALFAKGFRYRLGGAGLPGRPDVVLPKYNAVIFVHGCFWHGHNCPLFKWPTTREEWWREKIEANRSRDAASRSRLARQGWRQAYVWECALKGRDRLQPEDVVDQLTAWLDSDAPELEIRGSS